MTRRLLILSFSPIASDARVLKQIELFRQEFDVVTCGYGPKPAGVTEHVAIPEDLAIWRYPKIPVIMRQYRRAYWGNQAIVAARDALQGRSFDVILADDVDTVGLALSLRPRGGVHADLHEYSPRQHDELLRFRVFVRPFMEWMCRAFVARAQSCSTVSEGISAEYQRRFGFRPDVVTNAAPFVDASPTPCHSPVRLVHSGAAMRNRHLNTLIDAVRKSRNATLDLYLTPNDPEYLADLRRLAAGEERVRIHDPVPYVQLAETLRAFDVGVHVLPPVNFNNLWALPNKIFDYVQARLGVVVGPSPEMARYIERYGLGAVTADFGADALANTIDEMTPGAVDEWKRSAHTHARELSSEAQVLIWKRAIDALASST